MPFMPPAKARKATV
jgi:hypothetical protein